MWASEGEIERERDRELLHSLDSRESAVYSFRVFDLFAISHVGIWVISEDRYRQPRVNWNSSFVFMS